MVLLGIKKEGNKEQKKLVAKKASELIHDGMVIGLGTGSTVSFLIKEIGEKIRKEDLKISALCSSYETKINAIQEDIPLKSFEEINQIDLVVDGADQVDDELNLIKGGGAAHFREKILANYANEFVCIIDESKLSPKLNDPIPIEVHSFSHKPVNDKLRDMGAKTELREANKKDGPLITDNGNFVIDADFGEINEPNKLDKKLNNVVGLIEHGLFIEYTDKLIVPDSSEVKVIKND